MTGRIRAAAWSVAVLGLVAGGCGSATEDSTDVTAVDEAEPGDVIVETDSEPRPGGKVVYGLEGESDGFDPTGSRWATAGMTVALAVFDPLMAVDADSRPRPYLAESVEPNEDATSWTITLRPGVEFHDGTPVDAAAVAANLEAHRTSLLTSSAMSPIETITEVDDRTVRVDMSVPWSAFDATLTAQVGFVAAPSQLADPEGSRNPVGSGPFTFGAWRPDDRLTVVRNADYWRDGLPYLEEIEFQPISDERTRLTALQNGEIDVLHTSNAGTLISLRELAADGDIQLLEDRGEGEEGFLMMNQARPPFDDIRARQALAHAFDAETFNDVVNDGILDVARGPFHPSSEWYVETDYPQYDPEEARRLVAAYEADHGPLTFTYSTGASPELQESAQLVQSLLADVGVEADIQTFDQPSLIGNIVAGEYQAAAWRQFGATDPDVDSVWWTWQTVDGQENVLNFANMEDPEIDDALRRGRESSDPAERKAAYADLQHRMADQVPYVWSYHSRWSVAANNGVRGIANGELPDGSPSLPLGGMGSLGGTQRLTQMWLER